MPSIQNIFYLFPSRQGYQTSVMSYTECLKPDLPQALRGRLLLPRVLSEANVTEH